MIVCMNLIKKNETNISCAMIPLPELTRQEGVSYLPIQIYLSMGDAFQLVFKYIKKIGTRIAMERIKISKTCEFKVLYFVELQGCRSEISCISGVQICIIFLLSHNHITLLAGILSLRYFEIQCLIDVFLPDAKLKI